MNKLDKMIASYFQQNYTVFIRHRYKKNNGKNNKNEEDMNGIIDDIFEYIKSVYIEYNFLNNKSVIKQFKVFIAKCCELCWIMIFKKFIYIIFTYLFLVFVEIL